MADLQTLQAAVDRRKAASEARDAVKERRRAAVSAAARKVDEDFAEELRAATDDLMQADREEKTIREEIGRGHTLIGRKVRRPKHFYHGKQEANGIIKMMDRSTSWPHSYSMPLCGEPYIRHLKKGGTEGLKVQTIYGDGNLPYGWEFVD